MSFLNTSGKRLKALREKAEMSQDDLAAKLGISQSAYSRYEKDQLKRFSRDVLNKMALILDTTPEYILGTQDEDIRLDHFPPYLQKFLLDPVSVEYAKKAYLEYQNDMVNGTIKVAPKEPPAEQE